MHTGASVYATGTTFVPKGGGVEMEGLRKLQWNPR
jgi:hypothetical protein